MFRFCISRAYSLPHEAHHFQSGYFLSQPTNQAASNHNLPHFHITSQRVHKPDQTVSTPILSQHSMLFSPPPFWAYQPTSTLSTVAYPAPAAACRIRPPIVVSGTSALCNNRNRNSSRSRDRTTRASAWSLERCVHCSLVYPVSLQSKEVKKAEKAATAKCSSCITSGRSLSLVTVP
jgi:hypothetical protein